MRYRITIVFIFILLSLALSIIIRGYREIQATEQAIQTGLIDRISDTGMSAEDIRAQIAIYQSLAPRRILVQSRALILPLTIELSVLGLVFISLILGITRPLNKLSRQVAAIDPGRETALPQLIESGSLEVRTLTRGINDMLFHIQEYQSLIGNRERYRGWKQISRVIVHELNNILSPICTYAEYLLDHPGDSTKTALILDKIRETQSTLSRYRDLSHLPQPSPVVTDLVDLCRKIIQEFDNTILVTKEEHCTTLLDPVLIAEVLRNLVKNAREASPHSPVEVVLSREDSHIFIDVRDQGPGIPADQLDQVFKPGYSTKEKNSGIGLSIASHLVGEHQGGLSVENNPEKGCTFHIVLPYREDVV